MQCHGIVSGLESGCKQLTGPVIRTPSRAPFQDFDQTSAPGTKHQEPRTKNQEPLVSLFVEFEEAGEDFVAGLKVRRGTKASAARIGSHEHKAAVTLLLRNFFGNPRLAAS